MANESADQFEFPDNLRGAKFRFVRYKRHGNGDHEHCYACQDTICGEPGCTEHHHDAYIARDSEGGHSWTFWLCPPCFERFREENNLTVR